jgi:hypothetical protein
MLCTLCTYTCIKSTVAMKDGNGQQVYSAPATVQEGNDSRYSNLVLQTTSLALFSRFVQIIVASIVTSRRAMRQALPVQRSKYPVHVCWLRSNAPCSSTSGAADVATTNSGTSSSHAAAATGSPTSSNSAPVSHKSDTAKSSSSASPSQSVKANSVARDISSGAIAGIMFAVGLTSVLVTLVV